MAAEKPKNVVLSYFPFPGRAEPLRLALKLAGIDYTERSVSFTEFREKKDTFVFGTVPELELDGFLISQSNAALVYVGRFTADLVPADAKLEAKVHVALGLIEDGFSIMRESVVEPDAAKTLELRAALLAPGGRMTKFLFYVDRYLQQQTSGFFAGDALTVAELKALPFFQWLSGGVLDGFPATIFDNYPGIRKNVELAKAAIAARQ